MFLRIISLFACGIILLSNAGGVFAGKDIKAELKAMSRAYLDLESFDAEVEVSVFLPAKLDLPIMIRQVSVKKYREDIFYSFDHVSMLMNTRYMIVADHKKKTISYNERGDERQGVKSVPIYNFSDADFDKGFEMADSVGYEGRLSKGDHYVIVSGKAMIRRTDIFIDPETNLISELIYTYNENIADDQYKVVIKFDWNNSPSDLSRNKELYFSEDRFITAANGVLQVSPNFTGYSLKRIMDNE